MNMSCSERKRLRESRHKMANEKTIGLSGVCLQQQPHQKLHSFKTGDTDPTGSRKGLHWVHDDLPNCGACSAWYCIVEPSFVTHSKRDAAMQNAQSQQLNTAQDSCLLILSGIHGFLGFFHFMSSHHTKYWCRSSRFEIQTWRPSLLKSLSRAPSHLRTISRLVWKSCLIQPKNYQE